MFQEISGFRVQAPIHDGIIAGVDGVNDSRDLPAKSRASCCSVDLLVICYDRDVGEISRHAA